MALDIYCTMHRVLKYRSYLLSVMFLKLGDYNSMNIFVKGAFTNDVTQKLTSYDHLSVTNPLIIANPFVNMTYHID